MQLPNQRVAPGPPPEPLPPLPLPPPPAAAGHAPSAAPKLALWGPMCLCPRYTAALGGRLLRAPPALAALGGIPCICIWACAGLCATWQAQPLAHRLVGQLVVHRRHQAGAQDGQDQGSCLLGPPGVAQGGLWGLLLRLLLLAAGPVAWTAAGTVACTAAC